jgi:copper(I)-binding protein
MKTAVKIFQLNAFFNRAMSFRVALIGLLVAVAASRANANEIQFGDLVLTHPKAYSAYGSAADMIGVLGIRSNNLGGDVLTKVSVEKSVAMRAEIQRVDLYNGVREAIPVATLTIEAGDAVELKPGRMRIAFIGLAKRFEPGSTLEVELTFRRAGAIVVNFEVEATPPPSRKVLQTAPR